MDDKRREPEPPKLTPTQPSMPESKQTTRIEVAPQWASELSHASREGFRLLNANMEALHSEFGILRGDVRSLQQWRLDEERRRDLSMAPPPLTSARARQIIDEHPSQMDLEQQRLLAEQIIKNDERDKKIEETHALAERAAAVLQAQSDYMGMGKKGLKWATSAEGRAALFQLAVTAFGVWEILKHGVGK